MTRPIFGLDSDGIPLFCKSHRNTEIHVDVKNKRCQKQGCMSHPTFGLESDGITLFCRDHRDPEIHVNIVFELCKEQGCEKISQYDGYCVACHPEYVPAEKGASKIACQFFDALEREMNVKIQHSHYDHQTKKLERNEYSSKKITRYSPVDGFIAEKNEVIEFHGDDWHGHPRLWSKDKEATNCVHLKFSALYDRTEKKAIAYSKAGYRVRYIWDSEYKARGALQSLNQLLHDFDGSLFPKRPHDHVDQMNSQRKMTDFDSKE